MLVFSLSENQGLSQDFVLQLQPNEAYTPEFNVHLENETSGILRAAYWITRTTIKIRCYADYKDETSLAKVSAIFEDQITISIDLSIPEIGVLQLHVDALGEFSGIFLETDLKTSSNETGGFYVDYKGKLKCEALVTGNATGSDTLIWDSLSDATFLVTHNSDAKKGYTFNIVLSEFIYTVSFWAYWGYFSGSRNEIYINIENLEIPYEAVPLTIDTITYVPGFSTNMAISVLTIMSIGFITSRYRRRIRFFHRIRKCWSN